MRLKNYGDSLTLWLSATDTHEWANRTGESWPCSTLAGHRLMACFDQNGLLDLTVDGRDAGDLDSHEFNAMTSDFLADRLVPDHALHFVTVGQFMG